MYLVQNFQGCFLRPTFMLLSLNCSLFFQVSNKKFCIHFFFISACYAAPVVCFASSQLESSWNVMAHSDARERKWRGNWRMQWVASTLHTTSEHGVYSITTADAHTSAASSRLKWRPHRFKCTRPTKSGFYTCAITFQMQPRNIFIPPFLSPRFLLMCVHFAPIFYDRSKLRILKWRNLWLLNYNNFQLGCLFNAAPQSVLPQEHICSAGA